MGKIRTVKTAYAVDVLEEDDNGDILVYNLAVFLDKPSAVLLKEMLDRQIDNVIPTMEDENDDYFTSEHCKSDYLKHILDNANLKHGIQVRNCTYRIYVAEKTLYL